MLLHLFQRGLLALLVTGGLILAGCAQDAGRDVSQDKGRADARVVKINGETKIMAQLGSMQGGLERGDTVALHFSGQEDDAVGVVDLIAIDVQKPVDDLESGGAGPEVAIVDVPDDLENELTEGEQGEIEITEITQR
ncbi:MAG: hypothetical protein HY319_04085 [Armatimonadetes bacterium]|nr:hypothetical protein [Armatimonadota bacterium]